MSPEKGGLVVHPDPLGRFADRQSVLHRFEIRAPLLPFPEAGQGRVGERGELAAAGLTPIPLETLDPPPFGHVFILAVGTSGMFGKGTVDLCEDGILRLCRILKILRQNMALLGCQILSGTAQFLEVSWVHLSTSLRFKNP